MLVKKVVTDRETQIKYACLSLLALVLMLTTHHPKIDKEHVELIKDLDEFFKYPWGRWLGFDMLMTSIKERKEVSLSQKTDAIMGFVHALQLVLAEAVPTITEVVQVNCSSSSDSDMEGEDDKDGEMGPPTTKICPRHARGVHVAAEAAADCIIPDDGGNEVEDITFSWTDDEGDELVDNILKLINEDHAFNRQMFGGGVTRGDVIRMRKEAEAENTKNAKQKQRKKGGTAEDGSVSGSCGEGVLSGEADMTEIVYLITRKVKDEMGLLGEKVNCCIEKIE